MLSRYCWIPVCGVLLGLFSACSKPPELTKPVEVILDNPVGLPPDPSIVEGPAEGSRITVPDASFRWSRRNIIADFSYRLNEGAWSPWDTTKSIRFTLDDGTYTFSVRGRVPPDPPVDEDIGKVPAIRQFTVDAVRGPAIVMRPRYIEMESGKSTTVDVFANEVNNLFLAHIVLTYEPSKIKAQVDSAWVEQNGVFAQGGGKVIFLLDSLKVPLGTILVDTGRAVLTAGTVTGVNTGAVTHESTMGPLVRLIVTGIIQGETTITIDPESRLRRTGNKNIDLTPASFVHTRLVIR